jgi:hypothetical protein
MLNLNSSTCRYRGDSKILMSLSKKNIRNSTGSESKLLTQAGKVKV